MTSRESLVVLFLAVAVSCSPSRTSVSQYLDGCRDKQGFLLSSSLELSDGEPITVGPVEFRPPRSSYVRAGSDSVSVFHHVYCDSGDWGVNPGNSIRLKLYPGPPPADLYADVPEELRFTLQRRSPPIGKVDHEFTVSGLAWRAQVELWGTVIPSVRTAYLTTSVGSRSLAVTFVAEGGSSANPSVLESVIQSMVVHPEK